MQNPKALFDHAQALHKAGQDAQAMALYQQILVGNPKSPEVLFQIGCLHADRGDADQAAKTLRKALALAPKQAAIWQALYAVLTGSAAKALAREAEKARIPLGTEEETTPILRAIAQDPKQAEATALALVRQAPNAFWPAYALGRARAAQGNWAGAFGPLDMAHRRDPLHHDAALELGRCLARIAKPGAAEHILARLPKTNTRAQLELAQIYKDQLRFGEALDVVQSLCPKPPLDRHTHVIAAICHAALNDTAHAKQSAQAALDAATNAPDTARELCKSFETTGDHDLALWVIDAALARHADHAGLRSHKAQLLQSTGDLAGARQILHDIMGQYPDHAESIRAYIMGQTMQADDPVLTHLETILPRADLPTRDRRDLNYAAAKAMHDIKAHDRVFGYLNRANRLMAKAAPYTIEADIDTAKRLVADWPILRDMGAPKGPDDPVFFVTGLPRSGTTLVETILAAHPDVAAGGEMPFLNQALAPVFEQLRQDKPNAQTALQTAFATAGQRYLMAARRRAGGAVFADKAISTFSRIGHAATALPGAKFLIMRRDPRDVGLSIYRNLFAEGSHRYNTDLSVIGRYIRLHDGLVDFWAKTLPERVKIIDYQALTATPDPVIRAIIAFCGLPWNDACLAPHTAKRHVQTLSFAQVRQPINQRAVHGWMTYKNDLAPLIAALDAPPIDLKV